jgi:fused signal recognition particle receptor
LPPLPGSTKPASGGSLIGSALVTPIDIPLPGAAAPERQKWQDKLKSGLGRTASSISAAFGGTQIDEALYENLEDALLMSDAGVAATQFLIQELRRKVHDTGITHPVALKNVLVASLTELLKPLEKPLVIGRYKPTVIMVAGVNGAGKTTSIGKLTSHLASSGATVLLAAADTFRAAAREQLSVWADRNTVDIISQDGGDPAAVSFDAVSAGRARGRDVVLVDTAGRLPTQLHLMEELKKIKRVIQKAGPAAEAADAALRAPGADSNALSIPPHEILLVIDGNTGQNALNQVKAFDDILGLTGLIVTKLDGTAKGGMLAAIARERPIPVYFHRCG